MTNDELHRVVNLVLLASLMFAWAWSLATHRLYFTRRQIAVTVALLPLFAVIFKGCISALQLGLATTEDTWLLSFSVGGLLAVMAAPTWLFHDRKPPKERGRHG